ncbi:MAG: hypothetical protein KJO29_14670, partial [Bacteroidia bacterium]|nr:hypothetical protein [Bacteroidia bacterium]
MESLNSSYLSELEEIKKAIQASDELKKFLDEEEDDDYRALVQKYEGAIHDLYTRVANDNPLQLVSIEEHLLDSEYEGLYLPKALGYSVLRGRINDDIKYYRPQNHFKNILETIINSSNFEQINQRIGQSIQIGFSLSSDIWITNIIEGIENKRVKAFLQSQKLLKYRDINNRRTALVKFRKQFQSLNFQTAVFPDTEAELLIEAGSLKDFLIYRSQGDFNNANLIPVIDKFISNKEFYQDRDFIDICMLLGLHYSLDKAGNQMLTDAISEMRNTNPNAQDEFFHYLNSHADNIGGFLVEDEKNLSQNIDRSINDTITAYFNTLDVVNSMGYVH